MDDKPMYRCPECQEWAAPRRRKGFVDYDTTRCQACGASVEINFQKRTINGRAMTRREEIEAWTGYYTGRVLPTGHGGRKRNRQEAYEQAKKQVQRLRWLKAQLVNE